MGDLGYRGEKDTSSKRTVNPQPFSSSCSHSDSEVSSFLCLPHFSRHDVLCLYWPKSNMASHGNLQNYEPNHRLSLLVGYLGIYCPNGKPVKTTFLWKFEHALSAVFITLLSCVFHPYFFNFKNFI